MSNPPDLRDEIEYLRALVDRLITELGNRAAPPAPLILPSPPVIVNPPPWYTRWQPPMYSSSTITWTGPAAWQPSEITGTSSGAYPTFQQRRRRPTAHHALPGRSGFRPNAGSRAPSRRSP